MKYTPPEINAKATQKRSQYAKHGRKEVRDFDEWKPIRIQEMREKGFVIRTFDLKGVKMVGVKECGKMPVYMTEVQFLDELYNQYTEEYLARFGLNCKIPFEENAGLIIA